MNKRIIFTLTLIFATLTGVNLAQAHTDLVASSPANDEHLQTPPEHLTLTFGDPVMLMRITLADGAGDRVRLDFRPSREADADYQIALPTLDDGHYDVEWRAMAEDGHTMTGRFSFHLGENGDAHERHKDPLSDHHGHH